MKKRLLGAILCLALAFTLLPGAALAAPTMLRSVELVIDLPKAGDPNEMETEVTIQSFKSGSIDLLANGAGIMYTEWQGDDVETDDGFYFRAGTTYLVNIKLAFDTTRGYCANYKMLDGSTVVTPETFSATVNGVPATIRTSAPYFPTLQVSLTIPGERLSESEQTELEAKMQADADALSETWRAVYPSVTRAEADKRNLDALPEKVLVVDGSDRGRGYEIDYLDDLDDITSLIMDVDDSAFYNKYCAEESTTGMTFMAGLREVWLSPKYSIADFVIRMDSSLRNFDRSLRYEVCSHQPFYTAGTTLYIPESAVPELLARINRIPGLFQIPYTIKTYSGSDVYAAQKAGAAAAKDWCPGHSYTMQILTADRAYTYGSCQTLPLWYYSCEICGKCEYNPNHVDPDLIAHPDPSKLHLTHATLMAALPNDSAYVGVNKAGQHVYWYSCDLCGKSDNSMQSHLTAQDLIDSGNEASLEQYQAEVIADLKMRETLALSSTEEQAGMFTLPRRSDAKISAWAQSDVNYALNDNLLDTDLLGGDYTKPISRLQFCSVAVRLAELLTGKTLPAAGAGTFTDTSSPYVLKAYAAGITSGTSATTFSPNDTLTRQQMATFLYRTLRYVEKNSEFAYTSYTSKLDSYKDKAQVQSWATEAMAFMNALDLIKGTTDTTLSPNGTCTIEQAVAVAERSVYAHQIGWYQVVEPDHALMILPTAGTPTNTTFAVGDYVWVTGRRIGLYNEMIGESDNLPYTFHPVINPYTQQVEYIVNRAIRPVRG